MIEAILVGLVTSLIVRVLDSDNSFGEQLKPQLGPYTERPEGTSDTLLSLTTESGRRSGARYRVYRYPCGAQIYTVARRLSNNDWIGFLVHPVTGARTFWRANAGTPAGMDRLRGDFEV